DMLDASEIPQRRVGDFNGFDFTCHYAAIQFRPLSNTLFAPEFSLQGTSECAAHRHCKRPEFTCLQTLVPFLHRRPGCFGILQRHDRSDLIKHVTILFSSGSKFFLIKQGNSCDSIIIWEAVTVERLCKSKRPIFTVKLPEHPIDNP